MNAQPISSTSKLEIETDVKNNNTELITPLEPFPCRSIENVVNHESTNSKIGDLQKKMHSNRKKVNRTRKKKPVKPSSKRITNGGYPELMVESDNIVHSVRQPHILLRKINIENYKWKDKNKTKTNNDLKPKN